MIQVSFYEEIQDEKIAFVVICARYQGKWIWCKHKNRCTWEISGGHRERKERVVDGAKRELYEEVGAISYDMKPICAYGVKVEHEKETFGMLYYADVYEMEALHYEIDRIQLQDALPELLTYPQIQPKLWEEVILRQNDKIDKILDK